MKKVFFRDFSSPKSFILSCKYYLFIFSYNNNNNNNNNAHAHNIINFIKFTFKIIFDQTFIFILFYFKSGFEIFFFMSTLKNLLNNEF